MIGVEPLPVRFVKKGGVYCVQVDGDQGKRFKAQESPIVCLLSLTAEQFIFQPDAVLPGDVEAGFVGGDHAGDKGHRRIGFPRFPAEAVGSLVDVQEMAHAVSGSVEEVQSLLPEGLAGQDVQVMAICAFRKAGVHQVQHTPQHQGEMGFFFGSQRPQGKGAGNVGGPFQVLAAGIHQEQSPGF